MARVIIKHELDKSDSDTPVFRVTHGVEIWSDVPVVDAAGEPVFADPIPVMAEDGVTPMVDDHGNAITTPGPQLTEHKVIGYEDVNNIVFDADDDSWFDKVGGKRKRKQLRDIVRLQQQIIRDALAAADVDNDPQSVNPAAIQDLTNLAS